MRTYIERLKELLQSERGGKILVFGALAVMLLLLLSTVSCEGKSSDSLTSADIENAAEIEQKLERRLEELLGQIDGAGSVSVMVTLDSVSERVYQKDVKSESETHTSADSSWEKHSGETEVTLSGSAKQPLQIGTIQPKVRGAAVVCTGASDPLVKERVVNTVAKALNIGVSKVYVTY